MTKPKVNDLVELAGIFLRLGTTAFGGPAAHIAMMRSEFVDRRHWLTEPDFLDLVGASNLIPGPSSTEVAILIGMRRAGWLGLILAGLFFILPATLIVTAIAWAYVRYGHLPQVDAILYGIKPVIIAIIAQALWNLGHTALKSKFLIALCFAALALSFAGITPVAILFGAGAVMSLGKWFNDREARSAKPLIVLAAAISALIGLPTLLTRFEPTSTQKLGLAALFAVFVKIGAVVFGSGYVLLAFLRDDFIVRHHWLTSSQLLDAVTIGQFTPGPVFTAATFIGYIVDGPAGAFVATVAIFLPAFLFVAVSGPLIPKIRKSPIASEFLDGVNAAAIALMASVTYQLGRTAIVDITTVVLTGIALIALFRFKINSAWLVLVGALAGFLFRPHL